MNQALDGRTKTNWYLGDAIESYWDIYSDLVRIAIRAVSALGTDKNKTISVVATWCRSASVAEHLLSI